MKIVLLIDYFQPKIGYQEFFLAREFKKLNQEVFVVTSDYYFPFPDYKNTVYKVLGERKTKRGVFNEEGVIVHRLPMLFQSKNGAVTILGDLKKTLSEIKPNIVFSDGVFSPLAFQIALLKKKLGFKLFYDNHAADFNTNLRDTFLKRVYMALFRKILIPYIRKTADGFLSIGEAEDLLLRREYNLKADQTKIIRLGADTTIFFRDKRKRADLRKKLAIGEKEVLLIYAGKITKRKEIDVLLKAVSLIPENQRNFKILLLGGVEKKYSQELKKIINENNLNPKVIWFSLVKNQELPYFLNAADIAVWPGDISNAVSEAMTCGLAVILPKWFGSNYLQESGGVLTFGRSDPQDLKRVLLKLIKSGELIRKMGINSERYINKYQNWQIIAKKTLEFFKA